ncbi:transposase [Streptomyces sp. DSM 41699]|uniref:Transposase n=1 Tax=Streptomyces gibsoniae TaxID=3075529 RepID=A0ABU2U8E5_9ACTN|nr:transposase [Streptomyces sp. DSM 41699]MDT0469502.1 transposase [Streptomyces sp. DSM 41699]
MPEGDACGPCCAALGPLFEDESFAEAFLARGRPAVSPGVSALVSVLQYAEGLTDRQAADQVRARMDWKFLLGLELDDAAFDFSVLCDFRARLIEHRAPWADGSTTERWRPPRASPTPHRRSSRTASSRRGFRRPGRVRGRGLQLRPDGPQAAVRRTVRSPDP